MSSSFSSQLERDLAGNLPGMLAQVKMATPIRAKNSIPIATTERQQAGVLALFYPVDDVPHLAYIKRTGDEGVRHGGQISFPGGRRESADADLSETALREAEEEVGVLAKEIKLLGALSPLLIPVSNFMVHPFVGWVDQRPDFTPQQTEVAEIIEVPLPHLQDRTTKGKTEITVHPELVLKEVPYYDLSGHILWGATAMITSELLEVLS